MLRIMITSASLALAMPAVAQDRQMTDPGAQAPAEAGGSTNPNAASQVAAVVENEFPVYDTDHSGELEQAEFSKWILALKQQEMQMTGKVMAPDELTAWASAAFRTADADRSTAVSKAELTRYLGG